MSEVNTGVLDNTEEGTWPVMKTGTREEVPPEPRMKTPGPPEKRVNWVRHHLGHRASGRPEASSELGRAQVLGGGMKVSGPGPGREMNSFQPHACLMPGARADRSDGRKRCPQFMKAEKSWGLGTSKA